MEIDNNIKYVILNTLIDSTKDDLSMAYEGMRHLIVSLGDKIQSDNSLRQCMLDALGVFCFLDTIIEYYNKYQEARHADISNIEEEIKNLEFRIRQQNRKLKEQEEQIARLNEKIKQQQEQYEEAVAQEVEGLRGQDQLIAVCEDMVRLVEKYSPFLDNQLPKEEEDLPNKERKSKIKTDDISKITDAYKSGTSVTVLASEYGVSPNRIRQILREKGVYIAGHHKKSSK